MSTPSPDPRRFHCYCVGTGRTGSSSIAGIFAKNFHAAHEPESELLVSTVLEFAKGQRSQHEVRSFLKERDQRLSLELESDATLACFLEDLVVEFPQAKFLLTIRDCYTWVDSVLNHNLVRRPGSGVHRPAEIDGFWRDFDDFTFAPWDFRHVEEEQPLEEHGLRTLRHYLSHWTTHNQTVIRQVPNERLMVVRTDRIVESAPDMAAFLGVPERSLDLTSSHLNQNPRVFNLLSMIDRTFLEDCVQRYCGPLMQEYFPEIESYEQAAAA